MCARRNGHIQSDPGTRNRAFDRNALHAQTPRVHGVEDVKKRTLIRRHIFPADLRRETIVAALDDCELADVGERDVLCPGKTNLESVLLPDFHAWDRDECPIEWTSV